jgi:hypothetical protein
MGKRSSFERIPRDFYPTPESAALPLLAHVTPGSRYIEPCAGKLDLMRHLKAGGLHCVGAYDIEFGGGWGSGTDATIAKFPVEIADLFITNPPWDRKVLHPIIDNLSSQLPTWLLFDADWMHTRQSAPFMPYLRKIVSVGRVKWIPDSPFTGKDNCCWYLFDQHSDAPAQFVGRAA